MKSEVLFSSQLDASRSEHDIQIFGVGPSSGIRCAPFLRIGHQVLLNHYADLPKRTHAQPVTLIRHREGTVTMTSIGASYRIPPPVIKMGTVEGKLSTETLERIQTRKYSPHCVRARYSPSTMQLRIVFFDGIVATF